MSVQTLPAQDLLRRAIIEVASLPEKDLLVVRCSTLWPT